MEKKIKANWLYGPTGILFALFLLFTAHANGQDRYFGTGAGGSDGNIYSVNADGTNPASDFSFSRDNNGGNPFGQLVYYNGLLYGTCQTGAYYWNNEHRIEGLLYSFNPQTNQETVLYALNGTTDGSYSQNNGGQLTLYPNNKLYGTTAFAGVNGAGTIFCWDLTTSTFTKLVDLPGANGAQAGPLTLFNYKLYGTTNTGGVYNQGYLFSFDPRTNVFADLYDFGSAPQQQTALAVYNNLLYGVQQSAGPSGNGLIYSYDPTGGTFTPVYSFDGTHGRRPYNVVGYQNKLYGTTTQGGANGNGMIYCFDLATGINTDLHDLAASGGFLGGVVIDSSGVLNGVYGRGGPAGDGAFFKCSLSSNTYTEFSLGSAGASYGAALLTFVPGNNGTTAQTLTFNTLPAQTYGTPDFPGGATASSGLPVTYTSSDLTVAWTNGSLIHIVGTGTCTITATQAGNGVYAPASATSTLTVGPASLVIGVSDTTRYQYQSNPSFVLTYTGFVNGDSAGSLLTPPTAATTAGFNSPQGQYPITVSGAASNNYTITYQPGTLTVVGQAQDIEFTDTLKTYGDADYATATVNTGLPLTYASSNPAIAIITSAGKIHITGAGVDTITITQSGNATYGPTTITRVLRVLPATLSIRVNNVTKAYGQPTPAFSAVYTGLVNGDTPDSLQTVFYSAGSDTATEPGVYLIYATGIRSQDSVNYQLVDNEPGSLFITPAGGDQNSLRTWFSNRNNLQVDVFVTQQTPVGGHIALQVFDITGRPCVNTQLSLSWGYNTLTLPTPDLPAGVYIVRVRGEGIDLSKTITKLL